MASVRRAESGTDAGFRVRNEGTGAAIADALHLRSASRYNDGSVAESVTLEPMDGILLRRQTWCQARRSPVFGVAGEGVVRPPPPPLPPRGGRARDAGGTSR